MSLIPDKILTDNDISDFVKKANSNADKIVGESKFKIPPTEVPGSGLLIKLWIRQIEQGLSTYIAPIAAFKNIITNSSPAKLIPDLTSLISEIKSFFSDPLQSILDFTINKKIKDESPFPIKLLHEESSGSQSDDLRKLLDENSINRLNVTSGDKNAGYRYSVISDSSGEIPIENGLMILNSVDVSGVTSIRISKETSDGKNTEGYLASLGANQIIYVSVEGKRYPLKVNSTSSLNGGFLVSVSRPDNSSLDVVGGVEMAYPTTDVTGAKDGSISSIFSMDPSSPQFNPSLGPIKNYIINDPEIGYVIKIPLSAVLVGIPLVDKISVRIGNFSDLAPQNPTRLYIEKAESRSGMNFNDLLAALLSGRYPVFDFFKIAENQKNPGKNPKEEAQLEIAGLAKLIEIAITDPLGFIKMIVNYIKMLLIPINFLFGVLKIVLSKITNPAKVIGLVIKVVISPIKFFCDIVSDAVLEALRSYLSPALQAANISYDEAKSTEERGREMGLRVLVSDIICGKFFSKFDKFSPNSGVLNQINQISNGQSNSSEKNQSVQPDQVSFAYNYLFGDREPRKGEIIFLKPEDSPSNTIRLNEIDSSNESPLSYMKAIVPGQTIRISLEGREWEYKMISSVLNSTYFSFNVSLSKSPYDSIGSDFKVDQKYLDSLETLTKSDLLGRSIKSITSQIDSIKEQIASGGPNKDLLTKKIEDLETIKSGLEAEAGLSVVSIKNPDTMYLFLVENYLPAKVVVVWESLKGILGLFLGTLVTFPSLLPAVFKSLFTGPSQGGNQDQTDLQISTGITADLISKMAESDGILEKINSDSIADEDTGEPRKSIRSFVDLSLFSSDDEDLIDNSLLGIKDSLEDNGFNLTIDGINISYDEFVKRFKVLMASYSALRDKTEILVDGGRTKLLNDDIEEVKKKIRETAEKVEEYAKEVKKYVESLEKIQKAVYSATNALDKATGFINDIISYISNSIHSLINKTYSGLTTKLLPGVNSQIKKTEKSLEGLNNDIASLESNIKGDNVYTYEIYNGVVVGEIIPFLPGVWQVVLAAKAGKEVALATESLVEGFLANFDKIIKSMGVAKDGSDVIVGALIQAAITSVKKTRDKIIKAFTETGDVGISAISKKLDEASKRLVTEQKSLNGYRDELDFYIYIKDVLQTQKFFTLWESVDLKYNYFKDNPIYMTSGLMFDSKEISGILIDLYRENTLRSDPYSRIPNDSHIRLTDFRNLILADISAASEIFRKIK